MPARRIPTRLIAGDHAVAHLDVAGQQRAVREHAAAADAAIMTRVRVDHEVVGVADAGRRRVRGGAVHGGGLAEDVVVPDLEPRARLVRIPAEILRRHAQRHEREEQVARPEAQRSVQVNVADQPGAGADRDRPAQATPGPDAYVVCELDVAFEDGGGVDLGQARAA
jgi:hypothetical protein